MITEETVIDQINVLEDGQIQVRKRRKMMEDGEEIAFTYHRHVVAPGDDLNAEDARVKAVGTVMHTPAVVTAYKAAVEAARAALPE